MSTSWNHRADGGAVREQDVRDVRDERNRRDARAPKARTPVPDDGPATRTDGTWPSVAREDTRPIERDARAIVRPQSER
jgi:hypothetical protein